MAGASQTPSNHIGTFSDEQIIELCEDGRLIVDAFERTNVKQACYELLARSAISPLRATIGGTCQPASTSSSSPSSS